jgi:hypothetical protein
MVMKRFTLDRTHDVSGISGLGTVAEGVQFSDGTAAIRWTCDLKSTAVYHSVDDIIAIHGHNGSTTVRWLDFDIVPPRKPPTNWREWLERKMGV